MVKLDPESQSNLEQLIQLIGGNQCCVFIGSGLSKVAGFPTWQELVDKLRGIAVQILGNDPVDPLQMLWEKADIYRDAMGEDIYHQTIISAFQPEGKERFRAIHQSIMRLPFHAFVTTNYDMCLENAANYLNIQVISQFYPELDPSYLRERHVYHVHGGLDPEHPNKFVGTIVLTKRDYQRAYLPETSLPIFLKTLFCNHTVVFIGYGLNDIDLVNVIQRARAELEERAVFELEQGIGRRKESHHFVIMHQGVGGEEINNNLDSVKTLGLLPIFYNGETTHHTELEEILDMIQLRTTDLALPKHVIMRDVFDGE